MFLIINILSCRFHVDYFQKSESSFFDPDMFGKISNNRKILYFLGFIFKIVFFIGC